MKLVLTGQIYIFEDKKIRRLFKQTNYNYITVGGGDFIQQFQINFDN